MKNFLTLIAIALALVVAGCGANAAPATDAADDQADLAQTDDARGGTAGRGGSGEVVEVTGSTAQVQNTQGQVAVSWTVETTFSQQVDVDLAAVTVGACVMVTGDAGATGDTVVAASVRITPGTDEGCAPTGGDRPDRATDREGGTPPSDAPTDRPSGAPDGATGENAGGARAATIGEVTAVSGSGFTISAQQADGADATTTTVTVTADTTYTATADAAATDVTVGRCITSAGEPDGTGAITATTIAISEPVADECSTGIGVGGARGRAAA